MRLFIAEKPNMALEIAKCLSSSDEPPKKDGFFEIGNDLITWSFGHILEQIEPHEYDAKYGKWIAADLPIIPERWRLKPIASSEKQFNIIKGLIDNDSITEIIHAGDPDREGCLLVDEILEYVNNKKPVKRILLNALDDKSIKKSLNDLRDNKEFYNLSQSALARSRADWLIGMNLTRAFSLVGKRAGRSGVLPVGRVKTPTMALVVRREREIGKFTPVKYFTITGLFKSKKDETFKSSWKPSDEKGLDSENRLVDVIRMREIMDKLNNGERQAIVTKCETVRKTEKQKLPFSLSALQIQAGKSFGYSPQQVLDTAQKLYEKKITSYPRSDCDYLPENQFDEAETILHNLKLTGNEELATWANASSTDIKSKAWNDKKISAHHAIIPTTVNCDFGNLTEEERNIYFLIARAYITQFLPEHVYDHTAIELVCSDEFFTTTGNMIVQEGWKILYRSENRENEDAKEIPSLSQGVAVDLMRATSEEKLTKPPRRFTEFDLVEAMKNIHKYVKNEELKKQLKDVAGIGTEATRAAIISELLKRGFFSLDKKKCLVPTETAYTLYDLLPDDMTYPDSTALWEEKLNNMVNGEGNIEDFLRDQEAIIRSLCESTNAIKIDVPENRKCPNCGNALALKGKDKSNLFWGCTNYPTCKTTFPNDNGNPDFNVAKVPLFECPACKGKLKQINAKTKFWGCQNESCKITFSDALNKPQIIICPSCQRQSKQGFLQKRNGKKGDFWSCSNWKTGCSSTFNDVQGKPDLRK